MSALPPGPRHPLAMLQYARYTFDFQRDAAKRYGGAFTVYLGGRPFVLLATPQGARELFGLPGDATRACVFPFGNDAVRPAVGEHSVLLTSGARHAEDRRKLARGTGSAGLAGMDAMIRDACADILVERAGETVPLDTLCRQIASRTMALSVLGPDIRARDLEQAMLVMAPAVPMRLLLAPALYQALPWTPTSRTFYTAQSRLSTLVREAIDTGSGGLVAEWRAPDADGRPAFDREELAQQALTYLGAGAEALSSLIARTLVCTVDHADVMRPIVDDVLREGPDAVSLRNAMSEVMRRYPVVTESFREICDVQRFGDRELPAGTPVGVAIAAIHTHEETWPDPLAFRPSRFDGARPTPHTFLPFGGTPRRCLGASLAMVIGTHAVTALLRGGDVEPLPGPTPMVRGRLSMTIPQTVRFRVRARPAAVA